MNIYLAGPYSQKDQINKYAAELRQHGYKVTSSWLDEIHPPNVQLPDLTASEHSGYAKRDVQDILASDVMIFFTDPTQKIVRAGRHVEFGMAIILRMPIYVIGPEFENIFHYLPEIIHFESWDHFTKVLFANAL
jgi:nucleoside 2-deoxyribosyltransferase